MTIGPDLRLSAALLERYLAGHATPDEMAELQQWAAEHPDDELARALMSGHVSQSDPTQVDRVWQRTQRKMESATPVARPATTTPGRSAPWRTALQWGSAFGVVGLVAMASFIWSRKPQVVTPADAVTYVTQAGQRATVVLRDGSRVTLGPATTLKVAGRTASVQGQALFTVTPRPNDPFTVMADGIRTTVLGTEFGVRAYDDDVTVAVRSGRVAVQPNRTHTSAVLNAQESIRIDGEKVVVSRDDDVDAALAFADGKLILTNVPLIDAIPDLNRWFDADVHVADAELAHKRLTATYTDGSRSDLASLLEMTFNARVVREGRTLTMYAK